MKRTRVVIVGGGPAGLTAASTLAPMIDGEVLVIERETEAGGIPRHSDHLGYGMRDLRRFLSGPKYAARLVRAAERAGSRIDTGAMVTGWRDERTLEVTSPRGRHLISGDALVLATGARERPRPARRIPGDRPAGVYTTGQLQNLVHVHHLDVGTRAVVIGAELVSWSAVLTLREAGCRTVAMITGHPRAEAYAAFRLAGRVGLRVPVLANRRVVLINGRGRVRSVVVEDLRTGAREALDCDTVITTGDWIPDHELARLGGLDIDPGTLGPTVDTRLTTSRPGVFAIGNVLHPVDTADIAALDGRAVAPYIVQHLAGEPITRRQLPEVRLRAAAPLRWVAPQVLRPGVPPPPRGRLLLWTDEHRAVPTVVAEQDGAAIATARLPWPAAPGRVFRVPSSILDRVDGGRGPVTLALRRG